MKYYPKMTLIHAVRCSAWRDCGSPEAGQPVTEQVFETNVSRIKFRKSLVQFVGMESWDIIVMSMLKRHVFAYVLTNFLQLVN